jgi:uncharacterized membrane protein
MLLKDRMQKLFQDQKAITREYESLVREFEASDLVNQNISLKADLEKCKKQLDTVEKELDGTVNENESLRIALKEQILDEKLNILKISREKLDTYFGDAQADFRNHLLVVEEKAKRKLEEMKETAARELQVENAEMQKGLEALYGKLENMVRSQTERFVGSRQDKEQELHSSMDAMSAGEIDEETVQKRIRQNNIELKIGLSWINKIGILLLLIGVATALKYTYSNFFTSEMKGIFVFLMGALLLAGGEWLNRKEKNIFALGLTGGGVGVMYLGVFSSYFILDIMNLYVALLVSVLITMTALILSVRYQSRTICSFALAGGFLPFFSYVFDSGLDNTGILIAMGYLFLLNLLTLLISLQKKWDVVNYTSFLLNIPTLVYLVFHTDNMLAAILYSILTFAMYLVITLAYPLRYRIRLRIPDVILLALNTSISCIVIYSLFEKADYKGVRGLLALLFCIVYLGLGALVDRFMAEEKGTRVLFYLTAFTFAILVIPFQFGVKWLALGWLVQGVLMVIYGYRRQLSYLEKAGWVIFGLCLGTFYTIDCTLFRFSSGDPNVVPYFDLRYLAVMGGLAGTLAVYLPDLQKGLIGTFSRKGRFITVYKYFSTASLWIFVLYAGNRLYSLLLGNSGLFTGEYHSFNRTVLLALLSALVAFTLDRIPVLYDRVIRYFCTALYILVDATCITVNMAMPVYKADGGFAGYFALTVLLLYNILVFFSVRDLIITFLRKERKSLELYPLLLSIYLLGTVTAVLIVQFRLGQVNLLFSLLYLVASFVFIIYGFKAKYVSMRRWGLGLSVFSTGKLFIYDLAFLKTEGRIASYFAFGLVLLAISFLYQRFKKSLDSAASLPMNRGELDG